MKITCTGDTPPITANECTHSLAQQFMQDIQAAGFGFLYQRCTLTVSKMKGFYDIIHDGNLVCSFMPEIEINPGIYRAELLPGSEYISLRKIEEG